MMPVSSGELLLLNDIGLQPFILVVLRCSGGVEFL